MLTFKNIKKNKVFFKIIVIFQILNLFLMTSCASRDLEKDNNIFFNKSKKKLKKFIIPKGITFPKQNKEYNIPYTDQDLEKKNYDIFPPI